MNINARSTVGLIAAAVLATVLVTGTAVATAAPNRPDGTKGSQADQSAASQQASASSVNTAGTEQLFVPITPCRIIDTRSAGGKLAAFTARSFYVSGTAGFTGQGGKAGGCGVPAAATGVSVSLTTTTASTTGRLVAYPYGDATPTSTMLSYQAGRNVTSTPTVTITPDGVRHMTVYNWSASVHMVADVLGYFIPQMSAYITADGGMYTGARLVSWGRSEVGKYEVEFDEDITACNGVASAGQGPYIVSVVAEGTVAYVDVYDASGAPADAAFNIAIVC